MVEVDFVVNCYERTYRTVLEPGYVSELATSQRFAFSSITILVNNVSDPHDVAARREALLASDPAVSRVELVSDLLPAALRASGLTERRLGRLPHFTDCVLAAVTMPGPDWVVYWDADARLRQPHDWITPTLQRMDDDSLVIGNPNNWHDGLAVREAVSVDGPFAVGFGFSDVVFLARRRDLARPIYRKVSPASWRYPLAHVEPIFEQRIDAWMRRSGKLRVTYLPAVVTHPDTVGINYPDAGLRERVRARTQRRLASMAARVSAHPAMRPWPHRP
jgi:hypothetical protein